MNTDADYDFTVVSDAETEEETKIVFEEVGEEFIGEFLGFRELQDRESGTHYKQARFRKEDGLYFVRANHSLANGLNGVRIGSMVKVTYAADIDTGQASPMRGFTVAVGRQKTVKAAKPTTRASAAGKTG